MLYGVFYPEKIPLVSDFFVLADRFFMITSEKGSFGFKFNSESEKPTILGSQQYGFFDFVNFQLKFGQKYELREQTSSGYVYLIGVLPKSKEKFNDKQKLQLLESHFSDFYVDVYREVAQSVCSVLDIEILGSVSNTISLLTRDTREDFDFYMLNSLEEKLLEILAGEKKKKSGVPPRE